MKIKKRIPGLTVMIAGAVIVSTALLTDNEPQPQTTQVSVVMDKNAAEKPIQTTKDSGKLKKTKLTPQPHIKQKMPEQPQIDEYDLSHLGGVLQVTYAEEEILDENWEEEEEAEYEETQRWQEESMSEEELAARAQINQLENQLHQNTPVQPLDDDMLSQLEKMFQVEDNPTEDVEATQRLLDLQCSDSLCRVAIEVVDEYSQFEILDTLPQQFDWVDHSYADVLVKPDDRRIVTIYLTRLENSQIDYEF